MRSFPKAIVMLLNTNKIRFLKIEKVFQKENSMKITWRKVASVENFFKIVSNYCFSILKICFCDWFSKCVYYGHKKTAA